MKQTGVISYETEGRHAGCWVMPFESLTGTDEHESDKIIVRSNGTVTTGKDIAYQLWKLGKLGLDFHYNVFRTYRTGTCCGSRLPTPKLRRRAAARASALRRWRHRLQRDRFAAVIIRRTSSLDVAAVVPEIGDDASVTSVTKWSRCRLRRAKSSGSN